MKLILKSKKGITIDFLVMSMVVLVGFVLLSFVLVRFMADFDDKEAEIMCHDSIALRGATALNVGGSDSDLIEASIRPIPVTCRTIDVKVQGTREEIMKKVADKSARCWWMFGEGRYEELLHGSDITLFPKLMGTHNLENKCFNCYTLTIDQNEIEGGPITSDDMRRYMTHNKYSGFNISYIDYIQTFGGPGKFAITAPSILPRESYSVSMAPKNHEPGGFWSGVGKFAIGGLVVVGIIGAGVCIVATLGVCTAAVGPLGVVATGLTGAGLLFLSAPVIVGSVAVIGGVGAAYVLHSGYMDMMSNMYGEREVSSIYVGFVEVGQEMCGSGDIAGE